MERQKLALAEKMEKAKLQMEEARRTLEQTQKNLLLATKNTMKLDNHKDAWLQEEKRIETVVADYP